MTPAEPSATHDARVRTVEQLVRQRLSDALGGRRGVVEAIVPTLGFTATVDHDRSTSSSHLRSGVRAPSSSSSYGWCSAPRSSTC